MVSEAVYFAYVTQHSFPGQASRRAAFPPGSTRSHVVRAITEVAQVYKLKTDVLRTVGTVNRRCHRCWGVWNVLLNNRHGNLMQAPHMPSIKRHSS